MIGYDVMVQRATRGYRFLASAEGKRLGFEVGLLNSDTLDLSDACGCALGETYEMGNYWDAADRLADEGYPIITLDDATVLDAKEEDRSPTYLWERSHGFMLIMGGDFLGFPEQDSAFAELTRAWREVIKKERDHDGA